MILFIFINEFETTMSIGGIGTMDGKYPKEGEAGGSSSMPEEETPEVTEVSPKYPKWIGYLSERSSIRIESREFFTSSKLDDNFRKESISRYENMPEKVYIESTEYAKPLQLTEEHKTRILKNPITRPLRSLGFNNLWLCFMPNWAWNSSVNDITSPFGELELPESYGKLFSAVTKTDMKSCIKNIATIRTNFPYVARNYAFHYDTKLGFIDPDSMEAIHPEVPWKFINFQCTDIIESRVEEGRCKKYTYTKTLDPVEAHGKYISPVHAPFKKYTHITTNMSMPHANQGVWVVVDPTASEFNSILSFVHKIYHLSHSLLSIVQDTDAIIEETRDNIDLLRESNYIMMMNARINTLDRRLNRQKKLFDTENAILSENIKACIQKRANCGIFDMGPF